jgi:hypothetical protein
MQLLMLHRPPPLPPVAELARPELKLAGALLPLHHRSHPRETSHSARFSCSYSSSAELLLSRLPALNSALWIRPTASWARLQSSCSPDGYVSVAIRFSRT